MSCELHAGVTMDTLYLYIRGCFGLAGKSFPDPDYNTVVMSSNRKKVIVTEADSKVEFDQFI